MSTPFRVCLFGFAPDDDQVLRRMLQTDSSRTPHYVGAASLEHCDVVVANADNADALAELVRLELLDQAVYIGSDIDGEGWLKHPVDGRRLLSELDRLALRQAPWYTPRTEPADLSAVEVATAAAPAAEVASEAADSRSGPSSAGGALAPGTARPVRQKPAPTEALANTRALLVDDSEIALRFLETRLHRMGVQTERATTSGRAIELLERYSFDFALLDVELGTSSELDGLALCQHIKRQGGSAQSPSVILVSAHNAELDRARGALAGCDGYLGKPLDEALLLHALVQNAPR